MRIVVVACYVLPLTTLAAWLLNIYAGGWQNSFYGFVAFFLLAVVSAAAGPILQFRNYRAKCLNFGTVVRSYSASIIAAIDRLERLYGGEAGTDHNLQSGRGLGQSLRRTLRRLWQ